MVNKRTKIKKTENTLEACFTESESTESGAIVGSNDGLITEILHRLPVTSILRFKSVSKHWQSLLSQRNFTLLYDKVPVSPGLFVRDLYVPFDVENPTPPPFRSLNFYRDRSGIKIVQSCNGLLLCCSNRGTEVTRKYYVFNPTTKQFVVLPPVIGGSSASRTICFMGLAFHRVDSEHYNVVCVRVVNRYKNMFQIQIYSSDTGKWRISQDSFSASCFKSFNYEVNYGVYLNGAVHWLSRDYNILAYFKVDVEQLQTMLLPALNSWSYNGGRRCYFGESGGYLHLVQDAGNNNHLHFNVYEILSDYSGWIIKYLVELDELPAAYPYLPNYKIEVFDVVRNEEKEESTFMVVKILGKIIRYDVVNKSFKQLFDLPNVLYYQEIRYTGVHRFTHKLSSF